MSDGKVKPGKGMGMASSKGKLKGKTHEEPTHTTPRPYGSEGVNTFPRSKQDSGQKRGGSGPKC